MIQAFCARCSGEHVTHRCPLNDPLPPFYSMSVRPHSSRRRGPLEGRGAHRSRRSSYSGADFIGDVVEAVVYVLTFQWFFD